MSAPRSAESGRTGEKIRGDAHFSWQSDPSDLSIHFRSKVEGMYGGTTVVWLREICLGHGLETGTLTVLDTGAYPWVLRARLESLLRRAKNAPDLMVEAAPAIADAGLLATSPQRERPRRSRLYLPGNEPKYMLHAAVHGPDAVILDLEDSVAPAAKEDARSLVRHALSTLDFSPCERMVRINPGEQGLEDLAALGNAPFELVLIPKVETVAQVQAVADAAPGRLLMPILETSPGILEARAIAAAAKSVVALTLGLEDLTADLGVPKTREGDETLFARSFVVLAAKECGLQAIDSVYGDVADDAGLRASVHAAKALGFEGKGVVHPRQISIVHEAFSPSEQEMEEARRIVAAFVEAKAKGLGVVSLGSKMIDPPVVERARRIVAMEDSSRD